jgi:NAD(P)-dependent dehydrogenase (short-subunit alcohol dehydrogenase family)
VRALALQSDLSQVAQTRNLFAAVLEHFGRLDIVVNNVGVSVFKPTAEIEEDDYDRVMGTNASGTFFALREAARHVADGGRIINLACPATICLRGRAKQVDRSRRGCAESGCHAQGTGPCLLPSLPNRLRCT